MIRLFKYEKLFSVDFMHAYYRSHLSRDLVAKPSQSTSQLLLNYGLLFKTTDSGFSVFAGVKEDGTLKKAITGDLKFTFFLNCINPSFSNFSLLPLEQDPGEKFYFSNETVNAVDVFGLGSTELLLNQGSSVTDSDLVKISGKNYSYLYAASGSSKTFHLYFEDTGSEVVTRVVNTDDGQYAFRQVMEDFPAGFYRLEVGSSTVLDRFWFSPDKELGTTFGILEIYTNVPSGNKFISGTNVISEKNFKIAFLNRSTYWRYKITNKSGIALSDPAIAVGSDVTRFSKDSGLNFTSNDPRELKEEAETGIRLLKDKAVLSSDVIKDMPNPGTGQIIPVRSLGTTTIFSDIFIYL